MQQPSASRSKRCKRRDMKALALSSIDRNTILTDTDLAVLHAIQEVI